MSKRYIPYARKFFESEEWTAPRKFSEQEAWLDMVFLASYATHDINLGKSGILTIQRGEFYFPQRGLARRWGWKLSTLQRYLQRLSEGERPRISRITRRSAMGSLDGSACGSEVNLIKLCNYETYNSFVDVDGSACGSACGSEDGSLNNKGYIIRDIKNTHTHYSSLKDLFVYASTHAHESADMCEQACKACEELLLYCGHDAEAMAEHKTWIKSNPLHYAMVEMYRCYPTLQQHFRKPLLPSQMRELMRMYDIADIWRIIEAIDNKRERIKGASLFQTIKQWATTDIVLANRRREQLQQYS